MPKAAELSHVDLNFTGKPTEEQIFHLTQAINGLISNVKLSEVSFYLNGRYIGGRPNDRG